MLRTISTLRPSLRGCERPGRVGPEQFYGVIFGVGFSHVIAVTMTKNRAVASYNGGKLGSNHDKCLGTAKAQWLAKTNGY